MRFPYLPVLTLLFVVGCSPSESPPSEVTGSFAEAAAATESKSAGGAEEERNRYMAYQHDLRIKTETDKIGTLFKEAQAACQKMVDEACVVLESQLSSEYGVSASFRFRAKAAGIQKLVVLFGKQGSVLNQSTTADDLTRPIGDSARKLAMLEDYRNKLNVLLKSENTDIESLIRINQELASVQSDIESLTGERSGMMARVETEILSVNITSNNPSQPRRSIADAFSDFIPNLTEAVANIVVALAYIIPWGILFLLVTWVIVNLLKRIRKSVLKKNKSAE